MIKLNLERDQARSIQQNFFPFLVQYCDLKIRDSQDDQDRMISKLTRSILQDITKAFEKKLNGISNKISFKLQDSQAVILYRLFMMLPIQADQFYLVNIRMHITDYLHRELIAPV